MPGFRYPQEAVDLCLELYLRYKGQPEMIEHEMRRKWPKWRKSNLYDTKTRMGWISRFSFDERLADALAVRIKASLSGEEDLYLDIRTNRERASKRLKGGSPTKADWQVHQKYCELETQCLAKLKEAGSRIEDFVRCWDDLLTWLPEISRNAARELLDCGDEVMRRAREVYGGPQR